MSIWEYNSIKSSIANPLNLLTLNEGNTPVEQISENGHNLFIKREDKNPTGSWKDRGTAYKMTELVNSGVYEAIISSSGNAAISFLQFANEYKNFKLHIVISPDINPSKRKLIEEYANEGNHRIYTDKTAKQRAVTLSNQLKIPMLRSSTDRNITKGYWSLGFELAQILRKFRNKKFVLFSPVSSGTALVGLTEGLFMKLEQESLMPKIIACQTESIHPLIEDTTSAEKSLADAIVDKSLLRRPQLEKITNETNGKALIITNSELKNAELKIKELGINDLSYTSLLSIAAYFKVKDDFRDHNFICIASGR